MDLQYLSDITGKQTAVVIPIDDWNNLTHKHKDLKEMERMDLQRQTTSNEKQLLIEEIKEAVVNFNLAKQGKLKLKSARDLYYEL